jgi:hypothetical protein
MKKGDKVRSVVDTMDDDQEMVPAGAEGVIEHITSRPGFFYPVMVELNKPSKKYWAFKADELEVVPE